jgi:hypothetical protein
MAAPETSTCDPWATIADVPSPCDDYTFDTVLLEDVLFGFTGRQWSDDAGGITVTTGNAVNVLEAEHG